MHSLKVFISSTCYDLKQIRKDLQEFISQMGYQPIMSEFDSFPVDPSDDNVVSCIQNIESSDLFVLIIGGRYGSVIENNKSITNMEYIFARKKGLPVFVYINRDVSSGLGLYKDNPDGNFARLVDDNRVFEFVNEVKNVNQHWCYDFDHAQDIISNLKIRLSHLFADALTMRSKMHSDERDELWKVISPKATAIALRKGESYELRFFRQVITDELSTYKAQRYDEQYDVYLGYSKTIETCRETNQFIVQAFHDFSVIIQSAGNIMNLAFKHFWGERGTPADLYGLYYVANRLAMVYGEILGWAKKIKGTEVPEYYHLAKKLAGDYNKISLENIWNYPKKIQEAIDAGMLPKNKDESSSIKIDLMLESDQQIVDDFLLEIRRLTEFFKRNPHLWE